MTAAVQTAPETGSKTTWKLDPTHTIVEFSAKHLMITTDKGRIADIEGTIYADENDVRNSSVEVTLNAASIDTRTEQRDNHLRSGDFLHVEQFPVIKFRSTRIEGDKQEFKLTGDLTIRDAGRSRNWLATILSLPLRGSRVEFPAPWAGDSPFSARRRS